MAMYGWDRDNKEKVKVNCTNYTLTKWYSTINNEWLATKISTEYGLTRVIYKTTEGVWVAKCGLRDDDVRKYWQLLISADKSPRDKPKTNAEELVQLISK